MMTIKEIMPKNLSGEGEGLFHRAISHSGTMLMPIDVSILTFAQIFLISC